MAIARRNRARRTLGMFVLLVLPLLLASACEAPTVPLTEMFDVSAAPPRPGYWRDRGENGLTYMEFTLTPDGKIVNFHAYVDYCNQEWGDEGPVLENGALHYVGVEGLFASDGKFHGRYSFSYCDGWNVSPPKEGTWEAEWVSEAAPSS